MVSVPGGSSGLRGVRGAFIHIHSFQLWEAEMVAGEIISELGRLQRQWPTEALGATMQQKRLPRKEARKQSAT